MEESHTPSVSNNVTAEAEKRDELKASVGTGHTVIRPLDRILDTFTYDPQLFEPPRAARRRRGRQPSLSLPSFAREESLAEPFEDPWAARRPLIWQLGWRHVLATLAVLILVGLAGQGIRSWLYRQPPAASAIDQIIGQELAAKVSLIPRELAAGRLEVHPVPSVSPGSVLPQRASRLPAADNPTFRRYHIHRGDTLKILSARFRISEPTIQQLNRLPRNLKRLKPGGLLYIPKTNGILHPLRADETLGDLAIRYNVPLARIRSLNPHLTPREVRVGQRVFIPGARKIRLRPQPTLRFRAATGRVRSTVTRRQGVRAVVVAESGRLSWPARGDLTSGFGWRWGGLHSGVDIANDYGTTIRAAMGGVVISAGWEGAYGYTIDIRHGNGLITRYAHCAQMYVAAGQYVERGQAIASMGSTGNATGPHVHFEVRVNGEAVDPRAYL